MINEAITQIAEAGISPGVVYVSINDYKRLLIILKPKFMVKRLMRCKKI